MKTIIFRLAFAAALTFVFCCANAPFAAGQEPLDGPNRIFKDELLENLVGDWKLSRKIFGRLAENTVKVDWVLSQYEAMVFIGYDNTSER